MAVFAFHIESSLFARRDIALLQFSYELFGYKIVNSSRRRHKNAMPWYIVIVILIKASPINHMKTIYI